VVARAAPFHSTCADVMVQAIIPVTDLGATSDLTVALVSVQNPNNNISAPLSFTIASGNITTVQSVAAAPNSTTTVATSSTSSDQVTVAATLQNTTGSTETLAVATYDQAPSTVSAINVSGQYVDVQVIGATASDSATSYFYYPITTTGTAETDLTLQYFDGSAWQPVLSSGAVTPVKDTTDNLDGTTSGGRFTVVFDATSMPQITQLTGTVFAFAPPAATKKNAAKEKPKISTDPADQTAVTGNDATFRVSATSVSAMTYQWYFEGKKNGAIAGATSATLVLHNVTSANAGTYYAVVTNANGSTNSKKSTLTVTPFPPVITAAPQSQTVGSDASVTFSVTATSDDALSYQWLLNGKAIKGAKNAMLTLSSLAQSDAGSYSVVVTNGGGAVTSAAATLTVKLPVISTLSQTTVMAGSGAFTLTVTGSNFVNGDVVRWNGDDCTTQFVNATTLKATVPANEIPPSKTTTSVTIAVRAPGADLSNGATLTVKANK
jgi:hypothetical protein